MSTGGQAPNTQSTLLSNTGKNKTGTALSTNIIVKVEDTAVGAIKTINYTENRSIQAISEVGTDGIIDSAPSASVTIEGDCDRVRFDGMRIATAFKRGFIHVSAQRRPFDIEIHDIFTAPDGSGQQIVTVLKNVWIKSISTSYSSDNFIISDRMSFMCETVYSHLSGNGSNVALTGGERGFALDTDPGGIEQQADRGDRRGALDAADLLHAFGST